jgi:transposase
VTGKLHGWHHRVVQDLPCLGRRVNLRVHVRRFCCPTRDCKQRTFVEQPSLLIAHARQTARLSRVIEQVGFEAGGEAGARVLSYLSVRVSGDTILRKLRQTDDRSTLTKARIVGIDDWAFRKGQSYGTIIVDLERHRVIDLLPDRTQATVFRWLEQHPEIAVVARDRSTDYAAAIQMGAPQALPVADRWHLLFNLRQMLERWLATIHRRLPPLEIPAGQAHLFPVQRHPFRRTQHERMVSHADRERRLARYHLIQQLRREGRSILSIASQLRLHWETVRKYYNATEFPERKDRPLRPSILHPYIPYLEQRMSEGCENAMQLWREIKEQGYPGRHRQVRRWLQDKRTMPAPSTPQRHLADPTILEPVSVNRALPSSKKLSWLLVHEPQRLAPHEAFILNHLLADPDLAAVYPLVQQFVTIVRARSAEQLPTWMSAARRCSVSQLSHFAFGLQQDYTAIQAAVTSPWSNGQTEGQVNRLKFIKRQMYGRAHFDLLRLRVLYPPGST